MKKRILINKIFGQIFLASFNRCKKFKKIEEWKIAVREQRRREKNIKHGVSSYKVGVNLVSVALVVCERGQRTRELAISTPVCW